MNKLQSLTCPDCGAPLTVKPGALEITCPFCGNVVMVPPEMRETPQPPPAQVPYVMPTARELRAQYSRGVQANVPYRRRSSLASCLPRLMMLVFVFGIAAFGLWKSGADVSLMLGALSGITGIGSPVVASFGGEGTGAGFFTDPRHLAIDDKDFIYVADEKTGRIQRFDPAGKFGSYWDVPSAYHLGPTCLTADRAGNVYVCQDNSLLKYNGASGKLLTGSFGQCTAAATLLNGDIVTYDEIGRPDTIFKFDLNGNIIAQYDKAISSHEDPSDSISYPQIAVDGLGAMYVLDSFNSHVLIYNADGKFITRFGSMGHATGQFDLPSSITVDGQSNIYISDRGVIEVFDKGGRFLRSFTMPFGVNSVKAMAFNSTGALYALGDDKKVYKLNVNSNQ